MSDFVLLHGGAHGAWCWERLVPYLERDARARRVLAFDLVGHGTRVDEKPQDAIRLADYVEDVATAIVREDLRDIVLVGHSLAGITIPLAAARVPERMRRLVYLAALIPEDGSSAQDALTHSLAPKLEPDTLDEMLSRMFCNDEDEATARWHLSKLGPEPAGPMQEPVRRPPLPGIPVSYLLLRQDQALVPDFQRILAKNAGVDEPVEIDAGHSAMISQPAELAAILLRWGSA